jgi:hypothetical protein
VIGCCLCATEKGAQTAFVAAGQFVTSPGANAGRTVIFGATTDFSLGNGSIAGYLTGFTACRPGQVRWRPARSSLTEQTGLSTMVNRPVYSVKSE